MGIFQIDVQGLQIEILVVLNKTSNKTPESIIGKFSKHPVICLKQLNNEKALHYVSVYCSAKFYEPNTIWVMFIDSLNIIE